MPSNPTTQRMGELHEEYLAGINGGVKTKASGSQWDDQGDGRNAHDGPLAFCWDGKSTKGKGVTITLEMIAKIREQAQGERPQIGLRWYADDALSKVLADWVAVQGADWEEVLDAARKWAELESHPALILRAGGTVSPEELEQFGADLERALHPGDQGDAPDLVTRVRGELEQSRREVSARDAEIELLRAELARHAEATREAPAVPGYVPQLPWTVVNSLRLPGGGLKGLVIRYDHAGHVTREAAGTVRVERSVVGRPRLMVNDVLVANGTLYVEGAMVARAWADNPSGEVG